MVILADQDLRRGESPLGGPQNAIMKQSVKCPGPSAGEHRVVLQGCVGERISVVREDMADCSGASHALPLVTTQDGKEVSLATAGHEPILYMKGGKEFESLEVGDGLPLGLRSDETYPEKSFDLDEGDLLLLYSDGAIDARSEKRERYGSNRLRESLFGYRVVVRTLHFLAVDAS